MFSNALPSARPIARVATFLRGEAVGGALLVIAAVAALILANSPASEAYFELRNVEVGYAPWHLELSLGSWAADGLLAIFFFVVGLELKQELVAGRLRQVRTAMVPVAAGVGGVIVPAVAYLVLTAGSPELANGWAIPAATDIAFAVAVLAIVGRHLPPALRLFLLTLAIVDDLIAITIIAVFYTAAIAVVPLLLSFVVVAVYGLVVRVGASLFLARPWAAWAILLPIGVVAWGFMHESGVHATIAGVLLAMTVPVRAADGNGHGLAHTLDHRLRPLSAGFAVPVFAFFSSGVAVGSFAGLADSLASPLALGIAAGLVIGKPVGIVSGYLIASRVGRTPLDASLGVLDVIGVALLAGIGFTVSLLVAELSFDPGSGLEDTAKIAVLCSSTVAALLGGALLAARSRRHRAWRREDDRGIGASS